MLTEQYLPLALHIALALGLSAAIFISSFLLGRIGKRTPAKDMAYECGMPVRDEASPRFSVKFYLVAVLFILFDIEVIYLFPWALRFRDLARPVAEGGQGWSSLVAMGVFIGVLLIGYVHVWRKGALEWD